jgi:hypothetical protein
MFTFSPSFRLAASIETSKGLVDAAVSNWAGMLASNEN